MSVYFMECTFLFYWHLLLKTDRFHESWKELPNGIKCSWNASLVDAWWPWPTGQLQMQNDALHYPLHLKHLSIVHNLLCVLFISKSSLITFFMCSCMLSLHPPLLKSDLYFVWPGSSLHSTACAPSPPPAFRQGDLIWTIIFIDIWRASVM